MKDTNVGWPDRASVGAVTWALTPVALTWALLVTSHPKDMALAWLALALVVVPVVVVALRTTESATRQWALDRGARVADGGLDQLRLHLRRTRVARTFGVTLAFATDSMVTAHYNANLDTFRDEWVTWNRWTHGNGPLWLAALGYVLGSLWAEATTPRDHLRAEPGAALLARRRLTDYLDPAVRTAVVTYASLAAFAVAAWTFGAADGLELTPDATTAGFSLVVAVGAIAAAGWTCRRRQRARDSATLVYEELTRTATANALAGAAVAMLGTSAASTIQAMWERSEFSGWLLLPPFVLSLLGVGIWIGSGTSLAFRTRRIDSLRAAA